MLREVGKLKLPIIHLQGKDHSCIPLLLLPEVHQSFPLSVFLFSILSLSLSLSLSFLFSVFLVLHSLIDTGPPPYLHSFFLSPSPSLCISFTQNPLLLSHSPPPLSLSLSLSLSLYP